MYVCIKLKKPHPVYKCTLPLGVQETYSSYIPEYGLINELRIEISIRKIVEFFKVFGFIVILLMIVMTANLTYFIPSFKTVYCISKNTYS